MSTTTPGQTSPTLPIPPEHNEKLPQPPSGLPGSEQVNPKDARGFRVALMGSPGSGKTHALTTAIEQGLDVFHIVTEPTGEETMLDVIQKKNLPVSKYHFVYVPAANPSWDALIEIAKSINMYSFESLAEKKNGLAKASYSQLVDVLIACKDFKDTISGKSYGDISQLPPSCLVGFDSLSGLNIMASDLMVGAKVAKHQGEWSVSMDMEERILNKFCAALRCHFALLAHVEYEIDEVAGQKRIMMSALGRKLAPKLPRFFGDVVHCFREGANFYWSTATHNFDLKNRLLPIRDKMPPTFELLLPSWKKRWNVSQAQWDEFIRSLPEGR